MSFFLNAFAQGYGQNDILQFLIRNIPHLQSFVNNATKEGYNEKQISDYLGEVLPKTFTSGRLTENKIRTLKSKLNEEKGKSFLANVTRTALPIVGDILTSTVLPTQPPTQPATQPPTQSPTQPATQPPIPTASPIGLPQPGPQIGPQPTTPTAPQAKPLSLQGMQQQAIQAFGGEEDKVKSTVSKLLAKANVIGKIDPQQDLIKIMKIHGLTRNEAQRVIEEYNAQVGFGQPEQVAPTNVDKIPNITKEALKQPEITPEFTFPKVDYKSLKKADDVITPSGNIGTVEHMAGDGALVKVDGKVRKIPLDQLKGTPEFIQQAELVIDPSNIPEEAKSSMLGFVYHSPDKTSLTINYNPNEDIYTYKRKDGKPFDEEFLRNIEKGTVLPVTTGKTYFGGWDKNISDSRGSNVARNLVQMAQAESEQDDPSKPFIFTKSAPLYIHPYMNAFKNVLKLTSSQYKKSVKDEKPKKPRKTKSTQ